MKVCPECKRKLRDGSRVIRHHDRSVHLRCAEFDVEQYVETDNVDSPPAHPFYE